MTGKEILIAFRNDLPKYSPEQLKRIPAEGVWSIGQMYDHIILVAHEYLDHVEECAALKEEQSRGKTPTGEQLMKDGGFPPIKIRLPDEMNAPPNNSDSGEKLASRIDEVIKRLEQWEVLVESMNPKEWVDLVEMHSRHHLRQKEELESLL